LVTSDQLPNNNSARKQNILKVLYISTSFPTISKSPSAHRLSLSLRSAVVVQCSLSLGRLSSPRLRYGRYVQFGGNVEPAGLLEAWKAREAPFSLQAMWLWCRTVGSPPNHRDTDHHHFVTDSQYLIAINLRGHRHNPQPTTHNPHDKEIGCGVGVAVKSLSINRSINLRQPRTTVCSLPQLPPTSK